MVIEAKPMLLMLISGQKLLKTQMQDKLDCIEIQNDIEDKSKLELLNNEIKKCEELFDALNNEYLK